MRYEILDSELVFYIDQPRSEVPSEAHFSIEGTAFPEETFKLLLDSFCRSCVGKRYGTQRNHLSSFIRQ